jgi:hypothetical protein
MSAADSSELIDSTAANLLGLHNALLALESQGTFEKFRPYAIPSGDLMRQIGGGPGTVPAAGAATPLPAATPDDTSELATGDLPDEPGAVGAP